MALIEDVAFAPIEIFGIVETSVGPSQGGYVRWKGATGINQAMNFQNAPKSSVQLRLIENDGQAFLLRVQQRLVSVLALAWDIRAN